MEGLTDSQMEVFKKMLSEKELKANAGASASAYTGYTTYTPYPSDPNNTCPSCERCKTCGHGYPEPQISYGDMARG